jgi:hypothetical protein
MGCTVNSFQAIAPLTGQKKGSFFKRPYLHQKLTPKSFIKTRYKLFQKHVPSVITFLLSKKKQMLLCMGRTSTANKPLPLNNSPKQLSVSWELNPARVLASKRKIFSLYI